MNDGFVTIVEGLLGIFMILEFLWPFSRLVRNLVDEKEQKIKEGSTVLFALIACN